MKVYCSRKVLAPAITSLSRILPTRPALPILNGFLVTAKEDYLIFEGTDLELSLKITVPAKIESGGQIVVPARTFVDLIRRLPEGELNFIWDEKKQQIEVLYAQAGQVNLNTWPASDYPPLQHLSLSKKGLAIEGLKWKNIIKKVLFAAAPQEVRPNYAGVYFQLKENVCKLVATDTYRLALFELPFSGLPEQAGKLEEEALFIPIRALGEVSKLLEDKERLEIAWDQKLVSFQTPRFTLTTMLLNAQFPACEKVIPKQNELTVEIERTALLAALERASLFVAPPDTYAITELKIEGTSLFLSAQALDVGSLSEEIILKNTPGGKTQACLSGRQVFFNTHFLLEPLKVMENQEITLSFNGSRGPAVFREEGEGSYLHLVLPVCRASNGVS